MKPYAALVLALTLTASMQMALACSTPGGCVRSDLKDRSGNSLPHAAGHGGGGKPVDPYLRAQSEVEFEGDRLAADKKTADAVRRLADHLKRWIEDNVLVSAVLTVTPDPSLKGASAKLQASRRAASLERVLEDTHGVDRHVLSVVPKSDPGSRTAPAPGGQILDKNSTNKRSSGASSP